MLKDKIVELRQAQNITQQELADILGFSQRTIASWESGDRKPTLETLAEMARYFHVSADYLLGLTDIQTPYTTFAEMHIVPDADSVAIKKGPPGQEAGEPVKVVERVIPAGAKMPTTTEELAEFVRAVMAEGSEDQRTT